MSIEDDEEMGKVLENEKSVLVQNQFDFKNHWYKGFFKAVI